MSDQSGGEPQRRIIAMLLADAKSLVAAGYSPELVAQVVGVPVSVLRPYYVPLREAAANRQRVEERRPPRQSDADD